MHGNNQIGLKTPANPPCRFRINCVEAPNRQQKHLSPFQNLPLLRAQSVSQIGQMGHSNSIQFEKKRLDSSPQFSSFGIVRKIERLECHPSSGTTSSDRQGRTGNALRPRVIGVFMRQQYQIGGIPDRTVSQRPIISARPVRIDQNTQRDLLLLQKEAGVPDILDFHDNFRPGNPLQQIDLFLIDLGGAAESLLLLVGQLQFQDGFDSTGAQNAGTADIDVVDAILAGEINRARQ